MIRLSPFALAGALLATGISILSVSPVQAETRHVRYADLDLASAEGRATLETRLGRAVGSVCWGDHSDLTVVAARRRESMAQAHADLKRVIAQDVVQMASR